jgi:hypothetical protein
VRLYRTADLYGERSRYIASSARKYTLSGMSSSRFQRAPAVHASGATPRLSFRLDQRRNRPLREFRLLPAPVEVSATAWIEEHRLRVAPPLDSPATLVHQAMMP